MKKTIVIKVHPIGNTKDTAVKAPEKPSVPLYKVLPLDPKVGITGRPVEDLRPGDVLFLSGSERHVIIESFSVTYIDDLPTNEVYIHGMDGSTHLLSEFVVVDEPASDTAESNSAESTQNNPEVFYKVLPVNSKCIVGRRLQELRAGDMVFPDSGIPTCIEAIRFHRGIPGIRSSEYLVETTNHAIYSFGELATVDKTFAVNLESKSGSYTDRLVKVKKAGSTRITGCSFSELKPGDIFYHRGKAVKILGTNKCSLIDTALPLYYPEDADRWGDTCEPAEAPQVDTQDTVRNAGPNENPESDTSTANDSRIVKGVKKGTAALTGILFRDLKAGDTFFQNGKPIMVGEDAHLCGDASYGGYLAYDRNGNGYFPEDADLFYLPEEMGPYVPEKARSDKPTEKGVCDGDRIFVKRKGFATLCSVFSCNLNVGDVITAIGANALKEEDFDRCAIVRRDGDLITITVSDLRVNDKLLALQGSLDKNKII